MVQRARLCTSTAGCAGPVPGRGTEAPHARGTGSRADSSTETKEGHSDGLTALHLKSNNKEDKDFLINVIVINIFSKCPLPTNTSTAMPDMQPGLWRFPCQTLLLKLVSKNKTQRRLPCQSVADFRSTSVSEVGARGARITFRPQGPLDSYKHWLLTKK